MIRKNKLLELFKNINNLLHSDKFKNQHVISKANFTRKRKLPFHEIIVKPYRFFYRIKDETVWIIALWHSTQFPEKPENKSG